MAFHSSYFQIPSITTLIDRIDRWFNPHVPAGEVALSSGKTSLYLTDRGRRELAQRTVPLGVEMQLYFSCVVKKRVLFNEREEGSPHATGIRLSFHLVEATSCDPELFASAFPERRELTATTTRRVHPARLLLDYRRGQWQGDFFMGR